MDNQPQHKQQNQHQNQQDQFTVIRQLGSGFHSIAYLVEDRHGNQYALKAYKEYSTDHIETFRKQSVIYASLKHQNLVKYIGMRQDTKLTYEGQTWKSLTLILQYVQGGQLLDLVKIDNGLSEKLCRTFFYQLLSGLQYMHDKGYSHRDIKPQNILIGKDCRIKLGDFGFSCLLQGKNKNGILYTNLGTNIYKAPQIQSENGYDGIKVDIFAAGILLYIIYSGEIPFQKKQTYGKKLLTMFQYRCSIQKQQKKYNLFWSRKKKIPSQQFKKLFALLITENPKQRPSIQQILQHPWMKKKQEQQPNIFTLQQIKQQIQGIKRKQQEKIEQKRKQEQQKKKINQQIRMMMEKQGGNKRGIEQLDSFQQFYDYEMSRQMQRNIKPLEPTNLQQDFIITSTLPYSFALLNNFVLNKSIFIDEQQTLAFNASQSDVKDIQAGLEVRYEMKFEFEEQQYIEQVNMKIVFGETSDHKLAVVFYFISGDRLYFKKIAQQIKYLFAMHLQKK